MNYWMTTHWPHRIDEEIGVPEGVFVVEGKQRIIEELRVDDLVWIYESGTGRTALRESASGEIHSVPCRNGRQGVVGLVRVITEAYSQDDTPPERYSDETTMWWRWYAPTDVVNTAGFIPRKDIAHLLDYKPNYAFRGFGDYKSGLKRLTVAQHEAVLRAFRASRAVEMSQRLERAASISHGGSGEGSLHREIKHAIAADPSKMLGEIGLTFVRLEYPFPTGDRIDVLLTDRLGRFVAVEVEPECDEHEICGPLQCMKYRSMLSYLLDIPPMELRTVLVSPVVHQVVRDKCSAHSIEVKTVPLPTDSIS